MKKISFIIILLFVAIISCNKNETPKVPTNPQLINYADSMLASIGIGSYVDILTGKLEGNFEIFAHYTPYNSNCTSFVVNTELGGSVANDTSRTSAINGGNLHINDLIVQPNASMRYEIYYGTPNYTTQLSILNEMYGNTNTIKLVKDGVNVFDKQIYIPKNIVMKGYNCDNLSMANDPLSTNDAITWNADYNNKNGVIIQFSGKDKNGIEKYTYSLAADGGSYNVSASDLSTFPKDKNMLGIDITLIRGSFFFTTGSDGRKYNFTVATYCSYYFDLE